MADTDEKQKPHFYEVSQNVGEKHIRHFWEASGERKVPEAVPVLDQHLQEVLQDRLPQLMAAPFQNKSSIKAVQLANAAKIVEIASRIPVYKERFEQAGIIQGRISSWEEFRRIPPIYKNDLLKAYPDGCVSPDKDRNTLLASHSTGSTGVALEVLFDIEAAGASILQTLQQFALQSGLNYGANDTLVLYYTTPDWISAIGGKYLKHFVSSLISPDIAADILAEMRPSVLSVYPTNLEAILPFVDKWRHDQIKLIITNSEQSTRATRQAWSKLIGAPVLDEYGSEEVRNIALEMPCGHYHTCDDAVIVEILNPQTLQPQEPGKPGLIVVTSLINTAMPFVRYVQNDLATEWAGEHPGCAIQWGIIEKIEGRINDAFLTKNGKTIPSGTILDVTYRMMIDNGIYLKQYELIQTDYDRFMLVTSDDQKQTDIEKIRERLITLLEVIMEYPVIVDCVISQKSEHPKKQQKTRPIKRAFETKV